MRLEQDLYQTNEQEELNKTYFVIGDLEYLSSSVLYSPFGSGPLKFGSGPLRGLPSRPLREPDIILRPGRIIIPYGNFGLSEEGIEDVHETYDVDRFDNLFKGHISVTGMKKKKRFGHEESS